MSKALSHENRENMDVLSYVCGLVSTNFNGNYKGKLLCISAEQAAKSGLRDLGYEFCTYGHIKHEVYCLFLRKLTEWRL